MAKHAKTHSGLDYKDTLVSHWAKSLAQSQGVVPEEGFLHWGKVLPLVVYIH